MQSYQEQEQGQTFHKTAIGRKKDRLTEKPKPDKQKNRKTYKKKNRQTGKHCIKNILFLTKTRFLIVLRHLITQNILQVAFLWYNEEIDIRVNKTLFNVKLKEIIFRDPNPFLAQPFDPH